MTLASWNREAWSEYERQKVAPKMCEYHVHMLEPYVCEFCGTLIQVGEDKMETMNGTEQGYMDVTVIVDGAVDESRIFGALGGALPGEPEESYEDLVAKVAEDAAADGSWMEIYVQRHDHPLVYEDDEEDTCAQYETDHHPAYSWNEPA